MVDVNQRGAGGARARMVDVRRRRRARLHDTAFRTADVGRAQRRLSMLLVGSVGGCGCDDGAPELLAKLDADLLELCGVLRCQDGSRLCPESACAVGKPFVE